MKMRVMAVLPVLAILALPLQTRAQTPEAEVLQVVQDLFDGMREKDEAKLRSVFHADARLGTGGVDGFISQVVNGAAHLDEVTFDEEVRIDGPLAMAWTPYNIWVNGEFSHCGVDVFVMTRDEAGWKIVQLNDTRRREGCDPERRG